MQANKKAVVLFSGGLDSTVTLAYAKSHDFQCLALSFDYGQKNIAELTAAARITKQMAVDHRIIKLSTEQFGQSALVSKHTEVADHNGADKKIPATYVPARNTIFLSYALAFAESMNAKDIFIGSCYFDYSGYPDCRPDYFKAFETLANLATKVGVEEGGIKIHTPIISLSKKETIELGHRLGVDFSLTVSCYRATPEGHACGKCDTCTFRKKGFLEANRKDETIYSGLS